MTERVSFDHTVDLVMELPAEEQEMLIEIVRRRQIEVRRAEIADGIRESLALYDAGELTAQTAEDAIDELHRYLEEDKEE